MASPIQAIPLPGGGQAPATASDLAAMVDGFEPRLVMRFSSTTERDAKITVGNRKGGMVAFISGTFYCVRADGGSWEVLTQLDLFLGGEGVLAGASPSAGTAKIRREGWAVLNTNGSGLWTLALGGYAMPNGLVMASVSASDTSGSGGLTSVALAASSCTLSQIAGYAFQQSGIFAGQTIRVGWQIVGW